MKVNELIKYISDMSIIDKLKLGISVFSSNYINTGYNKKEIFEKMDNQLTSTNNCFIIIVQNLKGDDINEKHKERKSNF